MRSPLLATSAAISLLLPALSAQKIDGETPFQTIAGEASNYSVTVPLAGPATVPASERTRFGNSNNNIPFSWTPTRYQQVFLGSEMPTALPILGLGMRQDNAFNSFKGQTIDVEMKLGFSTFDHTTLTSTYNSNFNSGTPTQVLNRQKVRLPDMPPNNPTNPQTFFIQIKFDRPFVWAQASGRNILIEIVQWGNSNNNQIFTFPLDAASGVTTTRLYASGNPTASTGTLGQNYGHVMCFLDKVRTTSQYDAFGKGCPGTGGQPGEILPASMRTQMGNSNNIFGHSYANQRYHQIMDGSQISAPRLFTGHSFRRDQNAPTNGGTIEIEVLLADTTVTPAAMSTTFASNITSTQTVVFPRGKVVMPSIPTGNNDPQNFAIRVPYKTPWLWKNLPNTNLLYENRNYDASTQNTAYYDAHSGDATVARVWGTGPTATTGSKGSNYGLVMRFDYRGSGSATPVLGNNGTPILGQSFDVTLQLAAASAPAALILGVSDKNWGPIQLPFNLTPLGAPLCDLLVSVDVLFPVAADANGDAKVTFGIPNNQAFNGLIWHNQFLVIDQSANNLGIAFSNGGTAKVGEQ